MSCGRMTMRAWMGPKADGITASASAQGSRIARRAAANPHRQAVRNRSAIVCKDIRATGYSLQVNECPGEGARYCTALIRLAGLTLVGFRGVNGGHVVAEDDAAEALVVPDGELHVEAVLVLPPAIRTAAGLAQDLEDLVGAVDVDRDAGNRTFTAVESAGLVEDAGDARQDQRAEQQPEDRSAMGHGRPPEYSTYITGTVPIGVHLQPNHNPRRNLRSSRRGSHSSPLKPQPPPPPPPPPPPVAGGGG